MFLLKEIWILIFKELATDNSFESLTTLFHCVQVNRLWCILAIPYLWRRPFSWIKRDSDVCKHPNNKQHPNFLKIINILFHFLSEEDKNNIILDGYKPLIIDHLIFPYPHYIREITGFGLVAVLHKWQRKKKVKGNLVIPFCYLFKQNSNIRNASFFMDPAEYLCKNIKDCLETFTQLSCVTIYDNNLPYTSWISLLTPKLRELKINLNKHLPLHDEDVICAKFLELTRLERFHLRILTHQILHKFLKALQSRSGAKSIKEICIGFIEINNECCLKSLMEFRLQRLKLRYWGKANKTLLKCLCDESDAICIEKEGKFVFQWKDH